MGRLLCIMVPTTPARLTTTFTRLAVELGRQCDSDPRAEFIAIMDPGTISIGEKLNWMVLMTDAPFVACVADDDMVSPDYVSTVADAIEANPKADVICYDTEYYIANAEHEWEDEPQYIIRESREYAKSQRQEKGNPGTLYRPPSDKMCWSTQLRRDTPCVHTWDTSDTVFAEAAWPKIRNEARIDEALYHFYYDPHSKTGKRLRRELDAMPQRAGLAQ